MGGGREEEDKHRQRGSSEEEKTGRICILFADETRTTNRKTILLITDSRMLLTISGLCNGEIKSQLRGSSSLWIRRAVMG